MSIGTGMTNKGKIAAGYKTALPPEADTRNDKYFYPKDLIDSRFHGNDEFKDEILTPATAFGVRMTDGSARRCGYKFYLSHYRSPPQSVPPQNMADTWRARRGIDSR